MSDEKPNNDNKDDSDVDLDIEASPDNEEDEAPEEGKVVKARERAAKKKKIMLFGSIGFVLFLIFGGIIAYSTGVVHSIMGWETASSKAEFDLGTPVNFDFPQIRTDLRTGKCRASIIRFEFAVQLSSNDLVAITEMKPQIIDSVRTHLRDLERTELVGRDGTLRLKSDLAEIINNAIRPAQIQNVVFKEFILQ